MNLTKTKKVRIQTLTLKTFMGFTKSNRTCDVAGCISRGAYQHQQNRRVQSRNVGKPGPFCRKGLSFVGPFCRKGLSFVGPFCRKGLCSLLQPATRSAFLKRQHVDVERTSALVVRLTAKVQPGRLDLPKSATAPLSSLLPEASLWEPVRPEPKSAREISSKAAIS